jgi:hypothetical protein
MRTALPFALVTLFAASLLADDPKPKDDTLGAKPPEGAIVLFNGENLDGWVKGGSQEPATWKVGDGIMTVTGGNIMTDKQFGCFQLHIEFNVPYMPDARGQARGNSGVYLQGRYEIQVLDSFRLKPESHECGAVYNEFAPDVNACKPPLQWQTYDITFHAPKVEDGKVVKKARVTIYQNSVLIHEDREIVPNGGGLDNDATKTEGPLWLQDHGNAVQYRNIWIKPLND